MAIGGTPSAGAASSTVVEPAATCKRFDPNIGSGACLRIRSRLGVAYTWVGTYHATDGVSFYCIDFLYDSRITASSARVPTSGLRNQLGRPIGAAEVAALNALISARAPQGSAGSSAGNAAIALIVREVMSDGIRGDGTVVYPPGLKAGASVRGLPGGTPSEILSLAQQWWRDANAERGPWTLRLVPRSPSASLPLGTTASYELRLLSASGGDVPGVGVKLVCSGPVRCPTALTTGSRPTRLDVTPQALGAFTVTATVSGPSAQGQLLQGRWSPHGGATATNGGVQRGWILQRVAATASARGSAQIVKATPRVVTQAQPTARAGGLLTDLVTVFDGAPGSSHRLSASLYGPFPTPPTAGSCTPDKLVGTVNAVVAANGSVRTAPVGARDPGYYAWVESLPGDDQTNPVQTSCGLAEETTLVTALDQPRVQTTSSSSRLTVPGSVTDSVEVTGLSSGAISLQWTLVGPLAPGARGCADLDWSGAPVRATGRLSAGNGTAHTPAVRLTVAGCYTFREQSAATATARAAMSPAGLPEETVLGVRSPLPIVPQVPTGPTRLELSGSWAFLRVG